jgi:hypothetical protein
MSSTMRVMVPAPRDARPNRMEAGQVALKGKGAHSKELVQVQSAIYWRSHTAVSGALALRFAVRPFYHP